MDPIHTIAAVLLAAIEAYVVFYALYYLLFALTGIWRPRSLPPGPGLARFALLVPAHNEQATVAGVIDSLLRLDYPQEQFDLFVLADNCDDDTAGVAEAAGAQILVRDDPARTGKAAALG